MNVVDLDGYTQAGSETEISQRRSVMKYKNVIVPTRWATNNYAGEKRQLRKLLRLCSLLLLFGTWISAASGQPPMNTQARKVVDKEPVVQNPEFRKSIDGQFLFKFYHNKEGVVIREEKFDANKNHLETKYIEE